MDMDELYRDFEDRLRSYGARLARDTDRADDLVQEVMLKAFRHLDQLDDARGAKPWLMTILRNTRLDRIRASANAARDVSLDQLIANRVGIAGMTWRVRQLGGRLDVRSSDQGTTVSVWLPLAKDVGAPLEADHHVNAPQAT